MRQWTLLKSVEITNCRICAHDNEEDDEEATEPVTAHSVGLFSGLGQLQHVRLQSGLGGSSYRHILSRLPRSVRTLSIDDNTIYAYAHQYNSLGQSITDILLPLAPQLARLILTDTSGPAHQHRIPTARGAYDDLLGRLINVQELTISPCAVRNLAESLGGLSSLRALRLVEGFGVCTPPFEASELVQFLKRARSDISVDARL